MLYLALGILGATVMPHNLYLHSGIVQTRAYGDTLAEKRQALKYATHRFHRGADVRAADQRLDPDPGRRDIQQDRPDWRSPNSARRMRCWRRCSGSPSRPRLFGIALLCCGINSSVTATLAGQIVMEGFLDIKLPPWLRRAITRGIAIVPAAAVTIWYGDSGTARLLILTQVVLSLQLSFAVFPLVMFTADKTKMRELVAPRWLMVFAWIIAVVIAALNVKLHLRFRRGRVGLLNRPNKRHHGRVKAPSASAPWHPSASNCGW